jgi:hypothetical protein
MWMLFLLGSSLLELWIVGQNLQQYKDLIMLESSINLQIQSFLFSSNSDPPMVLKWAHSQTQLWVSESCPRLTVLFRVGKVRKICTATNDCSTNSLFFMKENRKDRCQEALHAGAGQTLEAFISPVKLYKRV